MVAVTGSALAANCSQPLEPGRHKLTIESDGQTRSAVYFIPSSYTGQDKVPVVFDLHGSNSSSNGQLNRSSWDKVAEKNGFIVVAPQGSLSGKTTGTYAWNVPFVTTRTGGLDEIAYLRQTVKAVAETFCVDTSRIYASGYSGGGRMLSAYICAGHDEFAAAGFVHSLRAGRPVEVGGKWQPDAANCTPARPISIIAFAGVKDTANPYAGGGQPYWQYGFRTAIQRWTELDGCKGNGDPKTVQNVTFSVFAACKNDARIVSYVFANGNHDWPKPNAATEAVTVASKESMPGVVKTAVFDPNIDPASRMWDFFGKNDGSSDVIATTAAAKPSTESPANCAQGNMSETACKSAAQPASARQNDSVQQEL
ncbi:polyhydroxybutyrate depolymerase [Rhizobiaceae bacterium BDR2-2]|uniref:Polyhydroxybutyrate depolymerase n=1 Tax=Ectorhizobium quercum TaxID=2965071 RepID=A0AAE3N2C2_9HYPH|nr:PHB depolymerase family esterase [Ectorhizobium quercum]MCX8997367.1 polyhydroxybutyrate depolymerase [Ectorhizobium quercum]